MKEETDVSKDVKPRKMQNLYIAPSHIQKGNLPYVHFCVIKGNQQVWPPEFIF